MLIFVVADWTPLLRGWTCLRLVVFKLLFSDVRGVQSPCDSSKDGLWKRPQRNHSGLEEPACHVISTCFYMPLMDFVPGGKLALTLDKTGAQVSRNSIKVGNCTLSDGRRESDIDC